MTSTEDFLQTVEDLPTNWLTEIVFRNYDRTTHTTRLWTYVEYSEEAAREFYASLSDEERRYYAAEILSQTGWDRSSICFTKS